MSEPVCFRCSEKKKPVYNPWEGVDGGRGGNFGLCRLCICTILGEWVYTHALKTDEPVQPESGLEQAAADPVNRIASPWIN